MMTASYYFLWFFRFENNLLENDEALMVSGRFAKSLVTNTTTPFFGLLGWR
jgi:hypothetical protein